jgi:hypothetical protein
VNKDWAVSNMEIARFYLIIAFVLGLDYVRDDTDDDEDYTRHQQCVRVGPSSDKANN